LKKRAVASSTLLSSVINIFSCEDSVYTNFGLRYDFDFEKSLDDSVCRNFGLLKFWILLIWFIFMRFSTNDSVRRIFGLDYLGLIFMIRLFYTLAIQIDLLASDN
jgi:hypothetical protein